MGSIFLLNGIYLDYCKDNPVSSIESIQLPTYTKNFVTYSIPHHLVQGSHEPETCEQEVNQVNEQLSNKQTVTGRRNNHNVGANGSMNNNKTE